MSIRASSSQGSSLARPPGLSLPRPGFTDDAGDGTSDCARCVWQLSVPDLGAIGGNPGTSFGRF